MKKRVYLLFLLFFSIFRTVAAQSFFDNYMYQSWDTFGGLKGTTITDVIQTKDGYINIGTYEGLVRFDGVDFSTFKKSPHNDYEFVSVRSILQDSRGAVWIGSNDEGCQKISREENKLYTVHNGLPNNSIRALVEDKKGNIWVGTASGVIYITPEGRIISPQFEAGTVSKGVLCTSLYCDSAGRVWLLTAGEKGLFLFSDGIFKTIKDFDVFGSYFATAITQDLKGSYWIGLGGHGIVCIENGVHRKIRTNTILDSVPCCTIYPSKNGSLWFGTESGLVVYDSGCFYEYKANNALTKANINSIACDREENLWFATDRSGLGKLTRSKFKMVHMDSSVNTISEDKTGKVWVGSDNGLHCYENDVEVKNKLTEYLHGIRIRDVQTVKNGDILVSCYKKPALVRYGKDGIRSWSTDNGLAGNKVRVAIETKPGEIYCGTTTGLSIIHADGSIKNFKQINGLENEYVMALYQDTNDVIWIGTDGDGIYLMRDEKIISHINSDTGLVGNVIFKISQDLDGSFWVCTGSGISRIENFDSTNGVPAKYETINSENGIGTDSVFQVLADGRNNLWIISNHGISSCSLDEALDVSLGKYEQMNVKFYTKNDGLNSAGPTATAKNLVDRYGRLWFSLVDGFAIYDPSKVVENPIKPLVHIESINVDNKIFQNNGKPLVLKPGTRRVVLKYTGICFDSPERILFTHKLTNFDDSFSSPEPVRTLSYTNLKPGKHTFLVNAINGDGLYSEKPESLLLIQKPYIYQLPVFWIVVMLMIVSVIIFISYLRQHAMRLENEKLEGMVQERTFELAEEKKKSDNLIRAILPDKIADDLKDGIHSIGENFEDATILFSDIVDFTKTSSGHSASEIVNALNDLFSMFDERAKRCGVEKIKTIGDAYMAACGIPSPVENHAVIMAGFAKGMLEDLETYNKNASIKFNIRIGLNCGPVTAGVIGKTKFIYDVWGDTVNVASRMETASDPGKIRISQEIYDHLKDTAFKFSSPIECDVKGKGLMTTYNIE